MCIHVCLGVVCTFRCVSIHVYCVHTYAYVWFIGIPVICMCRGKIKCPLLNLTGPPLRVEEAVGIEAN